MIIKNDIIIVDDIRKSYFKRLKKWITEFENKIKKKIKKINKINNSKIVRNVALFVAEKIIFKFVYFQKKLTNWPYKLLLMTPRRKQKQTFMKK